MQKLLGFTLAVLVVLTQSISSEAGREDRRQRAQRGRIQQGVQSGELTKPEARRLKARQRHVNRLERRAEADGVMTAGESARIEKAQDRNSRAIYRQKHDDQKTQTSPESTDSNSAQPTVE
jgi:hypothetical protein